MTLIAVGMNHRSAPLSLLERASSGLTDGPAALTRLTKSESVDEALLLATCNRIEVYADARTFHGAVAAVGELLAAATGQPIGELVDSLYVHHDAAAVTHLFAVASGLDSMLVGESEIVGQLRDAVREAEATRTLGSALGPAVQDALRVAKKVRNDTNLSTLGMSLVDHALTLVPGSWTGRRALVVGAGATGSVAAAALTRLGAHVTVVNRTRAAADHLASRHGANAADFGQLAGLLADVEVAVFATSAQTTLVDASSVAGALTPGRTLYLLDLALPRDVDPGVGDVDGAELIDLERLRLSLADAPEGQRWDQARAIVADEVDRYLAKVRSQSVTPTVVALRDWANEVAAAEMQRLRRRLVGADEATLAEVETGISRVVDKLLHAPTVRIQELARGGDTTDYATALRTLFDLGPTAGAVSRPTDLGQAATEPRHDPRES